MLDYLLKMSLQELRNMANYFNLRGFEFLEKNRLIDFLIASVPGRDLQNYFEPRIAEDEYFGRRLETELIQQDIEDQFGQMGFSSRTLEQPISSSRPIGTIRVSTQTLNSLLNGMNIGGVPVTSNMIKFRTGKNRQIKRLQK